MQDGIGLLDTRPRPFKLLLGFALAAGVACGGGAARPAETASAPTPAAAHGQLDQKFGIGSLRLGSKLDDFKGLSPATFADTTFFYRSAKPLDYAGASMKTTLGFDQEILTAIWFEPPKSECERVSKALEAEFGAPDKRMTVGLLGDIHDWEGRRAHLKFTSGKLGCNGELESKEKPEPRVARELDDKNGLAGVALGTPLEKVDPKKLEKPEPTSTGTEWRGSKKAVSLGGTQIKVAYEFKAGKVISILFDAEKPANCTALREALEKEFGKASAWGGPPQDSRYTWTGKRASLIFNMGEGQCGGVLHGVEGE